MRRIHTLDRLFRYLKPYTDTVAVLSLAAVMSAALNLIPPLITRRLVDEVLVVREGNMMSFEDRMNLLIWLVLALFGLRLLQELVDWGSRWTRSWLGPRLKSDVRSQLYRHLEWLSLHEHDKRPTGDLVSRLTHDTQKFEEYLTSFFSGLVTNCLMVIGTFGFLLWLNRSLALLLLLPIPLLLVWTLLFSQCLHEDAHRRQRCWSMLTTHLQETLSGIRVIKAFSREHRVIQQFRQQIEYLVDVTARGERNRHISSETATWIIGLGGLIIWFFGGFDVLQGELTLGTLVAFYGYISLFYQPVESFGQLQNKTIEAVVSAQRVFEILDIRPEPYHDPKAHPMPAIQGRIRFRGVTFGYEPHRPVLHALDFDIAPGEMIGLVGRSGAGKSTTVSLIGRFYEVDEGHIEIDGLDIREIRLEDLRRQTGIVLQDPILFDGTIADNIRYGKPDATFADIIHAAVTANAHDFIVARPDGYDTRVGEHGVRLSGGEKQRIAIARALLQDPAILILDEPTSSVDVETERQIQEAVDRLVQGRTTVTIAHRLSTLRYADRLIVLDRGRIVETGTHQELLARGGVFYHLVQLQKQVSEVMALTE
ncbi:MAG: ABC transporter ATP-binding protein [Candidatus Latescibacteria bacterium]|nr:ABC transporter ATP-binding protein [Candidatus Latescibacterota bacterium]